MKKEKLKERQEYLFNEMASLMDALASPVRLKIIHFLSQAPHSVEQLSLKLGQTIANTSMHLKKMQRENILKTETKAQKRIYSLAQDGMKDFWEYIQKFSLEHNPKNVLLEDKHDDIPSWTKDINETIKLIKSKKLTLLDVRPDDEIDELDSQYKKYVQHIPYDQLKLRSIDLPKKYPLLIICRGRLCVMAIESTAILKKLGFDCYFLGLSWYKLSQNLSEIQS